MELFCLFPKNQNSLCAKVLINCSLVLFSGLLHAGQINDATQALSKPNRADFLEVGTHQASLTEVLKQIANKAGVIVHYSSLPENQMTVNCKGTLQTVLSCVMGANIDIVYRYNNDRSMAEVWILPVTILGMKNVPVEHQKIEFLEPSTDNTDRFLQEAKDPQLRMDAIARLAFEGRKDDMQVYDALKQALSDSNPGVRAQAIFGLIKREGENANVFVEQAMADKSVEVRLMALEGAGDNPGLLQQALNDSDFNVRQVAKELLAAQNKFN